MGKGLIRFIFRVAIGVAAATQVQAGTGAFVGAIDELSPDQRQLLSDGKQVFFTQDVDGSDWPRMFIYQIIHCTPEQAEAVTMDYELRPSFTPSLTSAKNESPVTSNTVLTDYVLNVPVLGDQSFTLQEEVSKYNGNGTSYRLDYNMVRGEKTKSSDGYTRFEPYGNGGTLMAVISLTVPDVWGAGLVAGQAESRAQDAATGFVNQVENEILKNPTELQVQLGALRTVLGN